MLRLGPRADPASPPTRAVGAWLFAGCLALWIALLIWASQAPMR